MHSGCCIIYQCVVIFFSFSALHYNEWISYDRSVRGAAGSFEMQILPSAAGTHMAGLVICPQTNTSLSVCLSVPVTVAFSHGKSVKKASSYIAPPMPCRVKPQRKTKKTAVRTTICKPYP